MPTPETFSLTLRAIRPVQAIAGIYASGVDAARRVIGPLLDLYLRLWLAQTFLVSGLLKVGNWDNALALARYEYPVSWMDPVTAAYTGVTIELIAPLLLALGLATRAAAAALLVLVLVIQLNYQTLDTHLLWAALLGWLVIRGAGPLSLDRLLARGLADSAVPLAGMVIKGAGLLSRHGEPLYLVLLRLWLAAGFVWVAYAAGPLPDAVLLTQTLPSLNENAGVTVSLLLALGFALRPLTLALILLALGVEMVDPGRMDTSHYFVLLLASMALRGAGPLSLDGALQQVLRRRLPELGQRAALDALPRVVVVGAGFGGLACVRALRHAPVAVTLIDRHNYHLFQPLLYQVATTALAPGDIAVPIRSLLREQLNARVLLGAVTGVDRVGQAVLVAERRIPYDYLVLATGASHSYFGHEDWAPYAPGLKRVEDATEVRSRLLRAFEEAEAADDAAQREALLTFLIVGAGPTGVELAGAIAELARFGMEKEFRRVDPASARVILVQAGPRILPSFPEALSARAAQSLQKLGVEVLTDSRVEHIDATGVRVSGTHIVARTVFWAAGVVASPAATWLGAEQDRSGRITVAADLSVPGLSNVFAVGDTAASNAWNGAPVPGLGPAAKQAGAYVGRLIRARVTGHADPSPFRYRHLGSLATIGRKAAVADFGLVRLSGALAWWLWGLVHVYFLAGMRNRVSVMLDWAWAYVTFRSSTRLITDASALPQQAPLRVPEVSELRVHHGR